MVLFGVLAGALVLVVVGIAGYASSEITAIPVLAIPYTPKDFGWPFEELSFQSEDGLKLTGWFIPAPAPSPITIIVQHGLGSNHGDMLLNTACLRTLGKWNLFYYNFRGHGGSQGKITTLGTFEMRDFRAALAFLRQLKPQETQRLGIYGHSLGASVAIVGAAETPAIEIVAAESPFATVRKTIEHFARLFYGLRAHPFMDLAVLFTGWRLGIDYGGWSPVDAIGRISPRPLFIIQGDRDKRIPMSDFKALWNAAKEPKEAWIVPGADHGDPWLIAPKEYEEKLVGFFKKVFP